MNNLGAPCKIKMQVLYSKIIKNFKTVTTEHSTNSRTLLNSKFWLTPPKKMTVAQIHREIALY